jgi:hypothetical protein
MHVEALNWSGMSVGDYANGLLLSPWALRKWRARRRTTTARAAFGAFFQKLPSCLVGI